MSYTGLKNLRERLEDVFIDPQIARELKDRFISPQTESYLSDIFTNQEGVCNEFREIKKDFVQLKGDLTPARSYLVMHVLINQVEKSFLHLAESEYKPECPELFICLFDTAEGINLALMFLAGVFGELYGDTNYREMLRLDPTGTANPPRFETEDEFEWAKYLVAAIDLFHKDPSGFTLLDESVAGVSARFADNPTGFLQSAGADMAQKVYKALYPLTEGI